MYLCVRLTEVVECLDFSAQTKSLFCNRDVRKLVQHMFMYIIDI